MYFFSVLMTAASVFVFMMPVESGEKVSSSITIVHSCTIILLVVSDMTPRIRTGLPYLSKYSILFLFCIFERMLHYFQLDNQPCPRTFMAMIPIESCLVK